MMAMTTKQRTKITVDTTTERLVWAR
jgi:hypothetical protein